MQYLFLFLDYYATIIMVTVFMHSFVFMINVNTAFANTQTQYERLNSLMSCCQC